MILSDLENTCRSCAHWTGQADGWGRCAKNLVDVGYCIGPLRIPFRVMLRPRYDYGCRHFERYLPLPLVHPGDIANEERKARHWTVDDLAARLHEPNDWTLRLLSCDETLTLYDHDFYVLADAFGTTPHLWRNLYEQWQKEAYG
jgi:plasmid maintenance system antidote protein VapI